MSASRREERRPVANPVAVAGAAGLALLALAAVGFARPPAVRAAAQEQAIAAQRRLVFEDRRDGAVLVYDAATQPERLLAVLEGPHGFLRGLLRGFARERKAAGIGSAPPFLLVRTLTGALRLQDLATGRSAELAAFGPDNAREFARFLEPATTDAKP